MTHVYQPIYPVKSQSRRQLNWPLVLTEPLAELVGYLIHNGKVSSNECFVIVRNTTKFAYMFNRIHQLLESLNLKLNDNGIRSTGLFKTQAPIICSTEFTKTFLEILECDRLTQLLGIPEIPNIIMKSPLSVQLTFCRGYFCSCPCKIIKHQDQNLIQIYPYLNTFIPQFLDILAQLNIQTIPFEYYFLSDLGLDLKDTHATRPFS